MKRILLKELLSFTEQAPQPPAAGQPAPPAPAPTTPGESPTPEAPAPEGDEPPAPENPGEYDFTRDFKNFESTIEKTKQASKKKFLDKMNQMVKDKKVTVNASRGYGQPQKDYTINKVTKASVDWYYNKNVVVLTDENGKEFFLTPGVNVKIEAATPAQPEEQPGQQPGQASDKAPEEPAKQPAGQPTPPEAGATPPEQTPAEKPGQPPAPGGPPTKPAPQIGGKEPAPEEDPVALAAKKKKQVQPVAEEALEEEAGDRPYDKELVNRDFGQIFREIIPLQHGQSTIDLRPYFKGGTSSGDAESWHTEARFEIPINVMGAQFNPREFQLDYKNEARSYGGPGQPFARGSVDIKKHGRFYVFEFYDSGGLDI